MKGTLYKTEQGWMVEYKVDERTPIGHKSWWEKLTLHPQSINELSIKSDKKLDDRVGDEVRFEIVKEYIDNHTNQVQKYAKLIKEPIPRLMKKGGEEIRSYHSEKIEKIMKEIEEEEYFEKLEMEYFRELEQRREIAKNFTGQVAGRHPDAFGHSEMMHMNRGYIEGYKKAKETLYTEEQVRKAISKAFDYHYTNGLLSEIALLDIIQSLKQPKK